MKLSDAENERMAKLYRQHILKEPATPDTQIVQLQLKKAKPESAPAKLRTYTCCPRSYDV